MTMVIILGGIDLSVGSALGICAIIVGKMLLAGAHPIVILLAAIAIGMAIGFINGAIISLLRIPDIIATLATMNIWRAVVFGLLGGAWLTGLPPVFSKLTVGKFLGVPIVLYIVIALYALFYYVCVFRPFGRYVYAIGSNLESAKLAGISITKTKMAAYSILGGIVGFASILYVARMGSVEMTVGSDLALQSIAAVIIGGTAVTGGRGTLIGTLAGVFFIAVMRNGIVIMGVPSLLEKAIIGTLIVLSVIADLLLQKRNGRKVQLSRAA